jgi:hypothetical protein
MQFASRAVVSGVHRGVAFGVARNVSRVVSNNITKASKATSRYVRTQNNVDVPLESSSQRRTRKVRKFVAKVQKNIKSLWTPKKKETNNNLPNPFFFRN